MRNDFLLHSNLTPFFWVKLFAPALLLGALGSGCSAGVDGAPKFNDPVAPTTQTPASNQTQNPRPAPAANPMGTAASSTQTNTSTAPASNTASGSAANGNAGSDGEAENEAANEDNAALPTPPLDPGAAPEEQGGGNANAGGGNQNVDDDEDDEIGDDNGGDDDDDRGDDDDDDSDDDDDDDGAGATPTPTPPPANPSPDAVTFTADIRAILLDNCGRCHASGGLPRFASNDAASSFDVAFQQRNSIVQEIQSGNMPADTCNGAPGSNGCVSVADFNLIRQWVADGAPE